jgi:hypothetical protein
MNGKGSGPIQVIPPGLLGLLNLKNSGRLPNILLDEVQPGIDLEPWWLRANLLLAGLSSDSLAIGTYNNFQPFTAGAGAITVPQNQWWFVEWYSASFTTVNQATGIDLALRFQSLGTPQWTPLGAIDPEAAIINNARFNLVAKGFWAPPGSDIGYCVSSVAVGALAVSTLALRYTPCPI